MVADTRITDLPQDRDLVRFKPGFGQRFVLTVDTEEEFDWGKPLNRADHSIHTIPRLAKFQQFCESFGVVPIYLVDYPIATSPMAAEILSAPPAALASAAASRKAKPTPNTPAAIACGTAPTVA